MTYKEFMENRSIGPETEILIIENKKKICIIWSGSPIETLFLNMTVKSWDISIQKSPCDFVDEYPRIEIELVDRFELIDRDDSEAVNNE